MKIFVLYMRNVSFIFIYYYLNIATPLTSRPISADKILIMIPLQLLQTIFQNDCPALSARQGNEVIIDTGRYLHIVNMSAYVLEAPLDFRILALYKLTVINIII